MLLIAWELHNICLAHGVSWHYYGMSWHFTHCHDTDTWASTAMSLLYDGTDTRVHASHEFMWIVIGFHGSAVYSNCHGVSSHCHGFVWHRMPCQCHEGFLRIAMKTSQCNAMEAAIGMGSAIAVLWPSIDIRCPPSCHGSASVTKGHEGP